jgi:hypothetical protein
LNKELNILLQYVKTQKDLTILYQKEFKLGIRSIINLVNVQQDLENAQLSYIDTFVKMIQASFNMVYITGGLNDAIANEQMTYVAYMEKIQPFKTTTKARTVKMVPQNTKAVNVAKMVKKTVQKPQKIVKVNKIPKSKSITQLKKIPKIQNIQKSKQPRMVKMVPQNTNALKVAKQIKKRVQNPQFKNMIFQIPKSEEAIANSKKAIILQKIKDKREKKLSARRTIKIISHNPKAIPVKSIQIKKQIRIKRQIVQPQTKQYYTIALAAYTNKKYAKEFIDKYFKNNKDIFVVTINRAGKKYHKILYGVYKNKVNAQKIFNTFDTKLTSRHSMSIDNINRYR